MRWTFLSYVCKTFPFVYNGANIVQIDRDFPELWSQMYCHLYGLQFIITACTVAQAVI